MANLEELSDLVGQYLPIELWEEAVNQANRSTVKSFKTGAVIFDDNTYEILARGCSHHNMKRNYLPTIHAEDHAMRVSGIRKFYCSSILITTIGKAGNFAFSSRPCVNCTHLLDKYEINKIYYLERMNNGAWIVNAVRTDNIIVNINQSITSVRAKYAREMRT